MPGNAFDRLARYYDWEHAGFSDDLPLYLGLVERVGGPILEAGCGTGRLLVPLARAGYEVVGLDSSEAMLALAAAAVSREAGLGGRVRLVRGDMRSARLGEQFGLAIVALDSFGLLVERSEQLRALAALRRHVAHRGLLVVDVANGNLRGGDSAEETTLHRSGELEDGTRVVKWVVRRTDHALQVDRLLQLYDESSSDGVVRRTAVEVGLRYFTRFELELLLERAGFFVEAVFGDYELRPFDSGSERLILVAHVRRPQPDAASG